MSDLEKNLEEAKQFAPVLTQPLVDAIIVTSREIVEAIEKNTEATNRVAKAIEDIIIHQWHSVR